jgi:hypothetical protein
MFRGINKFMRILLVLFTVLLYNTICIGAEQISGPIGIIGVVSDTADDALLNTIVQVNQALSIRDGVHLFESEEMIQRLGKGYSSDKANAELDKLHKLFKKGYFQSYSFQYNKAIKTLGKVINRLTYLSPSEERWNLFIRAQIFLGIAYSGKKKFNKSMQAFATVLRTRPKMKLARHEYSPKTIKLWKKAKKRLALLPKGELTVESDPPGADVYLDGIKIGKTPLTHTAYQGRYHLSLNDEAVGQASRWIEIGQKKSKAKFQLNFEGSIKLDQAHPIVQIPKDKTELPDKWWSWLGNRLGIRYIVAVAKDTNLGQRRLVASLVDLQKGRKIREGWLESNSKTSSAIKKDAHDLVDFLITGRAISRLKVLSNETMQPSNSTESHLMQPLPELPSFPQKWYLSWWPYVTVSGLSLAGGVASQLNSNSNRDSAKKALTTDAIDKYNQLSDTWSGVAIGCYTLAGVSLLTWVILEAAYPDEEDYDSTPAVLPQADGNSFGIQVVSRF